MTGVAMTNYETILLTRADGIARITLNRPDRLKRLGQRRVLGSLDRGDILGKFGGVDGCNISLEELRFKPSRSRTRQVVAKLSLICF